MKLRASLLVLMVLSLPFFSLVSHSSSSWYVKVQTSQVEIIVAPYNATKIISCLSKGKYIYAEVYLLTCSEVAKAIINAVKKGGEAYVVLSDNVYGGIPNQEKQLVSEMNSSGVNVKFLSGFKHVHSKAFVIDNETVIVGSINPTYYGIHKDYGVALIIHNSTIAKVFACIILNDYYEKPVKVDYPGIVVSPINSKDMLYNILSQPGHLYIAMEELYPSSGFYKLIQQHNRTVVTSTHDENSYAVSQLGAVQVPHLTAKVIVVGNYVYVGSVNLGYTSINSNRELGIIICNPTIAQVLSSLICSWAQGKTVQASSVEISIDSRTLWLILIAIVIILIIVVVVLVLRK